MHDQLSFLLANLFYNIIKKICNYNKLYLLYLKTR